MQKDASTQLYIILLSEFLKEHSPFLDWLHTLNLEQGAWQGLPRHARLCKNCDSHSVETEEHIAKVCLRYDHIRADFYVVLSGHTSCLMFFPLLHHHLSGHSTMMI